MTPPSFEWLFRRVEVLSAETDALAREPGGPPLALVRHLAVALGASLRLGVGCAAIGSTGGPPPALLARGLASLHASGLAPALAAETLPRLDGLGMAALELGTVSVGARSDERPWADVLRRIDVLTGRGNEDELDRIELLEAADDVLAEAAALAALGYPPEPRLAAEARRLRRRVTYNLSPDVAARIGRFLVNEGTDRAATAESFGATLWGEAVSAQPCLQAWTEGLGERRPTADPPAPRVLELHARSVELSRRFRSGVAALQAAAAAGGIPPGAKLLFPPGHPVPGLPTVLLGGVDGEWLVVVVGARIDGVSQGGIELTAEVGDGVMAVASPWSVRREGPLILALSEGSRSWVIEVHLR